jgi:hypothetical protein
MDDTPRYEYDNADLVKITIIVTNKGSESFVVLDKMFELWIMEPNKKDSKEFSLVDNYDTTYDDEFEVRYEEMNSRELYNECDQTIEGIDTGESLNFTLCYDILRLHNKGAVDLQGSKRYVLVMMDNQQSTSCPNCKKIMLTKESGSQMQIMPKWVLKLVDWKNRFLISEEEFQKAMEYLASRGIIDMDSEKSLGGLAAKNKELANYQHILSSAYNKNLFVSAIQMLEARDSADFTGMICKKQNNVITLDADYTNENTEYEVIFFRLKVFDSSGNVAIDGLSKIVDVAPKSFRHVSVSAPAVQDPNYCTISVDSRFP